MTDIEKLQELARLAEPLSRIVAQYLKDIDDTAALLKDPTPPPLVNERMALSNYNAFRIIHLEPRF